MGGLGKRKEIRSDTVLHRKPDILFNEIDGEIVMLSIENSEYYGMTNVGTRIWELLENPTSLRILIETLMAEYEVTEKQCRIDTLKFLEKLTEKNLLEIDY